MHPNNGFSFIEVLITLTIMLLLTAIGIPSYQFLIQDTKEKLQRHDIVNLLKQAQQEALLRRIPIALCKYKKGSCDKNGNEIILFLNAQQDGILHESNNILARIKLPKDRHLEWRTYPYYRHYFLFFSNNVISNDNGTLWFCEGNTAKWAIILSQYGRIDTRLPDTSAILTDAKGNVLQC